MTKNNKLLLGILAFIVTLTIGYAVFTQSVTVSGTATANGTFNMQITSATVIEQVGSSGATVSVSNDKHTMTISVPKLEYPGAYVIIDYTIKNNGTIDSFLTGIQTTGADYYDTIGSTKAVRIQPFVKANADYSSSSSSAFGTGALNKYYFVPTDEINHKMAIYWKDIVNITSAESANITINFDFEQVTGKEEACNKMTEILNETTSCVSNQGPCPPNGSIIDFDFNGRYNISDLSDGSKIKSFEMYMGCS